MNNDSLNSFALQKLRALEDKNQRRELVDITRTKGMHCKHAAGEDLISFADNDYLGLSTHPDVIAAANEATSRYGAGSGASRLVTGNHPLFTELEKQIARIKGTEAAIIFGSGYLANAGIIPALAGKADLIIADELVHASIHTGISLSGAKTLFAKHNDLSSFEALLCDNRSAYQNTLIIVDGIYSMDGDMAPLKELGNLAKEHKAWLMADDAHGLGCVGGGRGSTHACGADGLAPLQMGTLSKSVGSYGGYLAASQPVIDLMKSRARSLVYTTGLPPGAIGGAIAAMHIIENDRALCERPLSLARRFCKALDLPVPQTPIVPLIIGAEQTTMAASAALRENGFQVSAIRPPTVPDGTSRLRFCFSATHTDDDLDTLIKACKSIGLGS